MKLKEISNIRTGLVLGRKKARIEEEAQKKYKLLTLNNVSPEGNLSPPFEEYHSTEALQPQYFTKEGDVLFRMTHPFTTVHIDKEYENLLIPSYFSIIKVIHEDFTPEYVAWYLNREYVKHSLKKIQSGSTLTSTNNKILGEIELRDISLNVQNTLTEIYMLQKKELQLLQELLQEKKKLYNNAMESLLEKGEMNND